MERSPHYFASPCYWPSSGPGVLTYSLRGRAPVVGARTGMQPSRQEVCGWPSTLEMPKVPGAEQKETSGLAAALIKG